MNEKLIKLLVWHLNNSYTSDMWSWSDHYSTTDSTLVSNYRATLYNTYIYPSRPLFPLKSVKRRKDNQKCCWIRNTSHLLATIDVDDSVTGYCMNYVATMIESSCWSLRIKNDCCNYVSPIEAYSPWL